MPITTPPQSDQRHISAYIVITQDHFFDDLFYQRVQEISPAFQGLTTSRCISDLVSLGGTDFNVNDGRFWCLGGYLNQYYGLVSSASPTTNLLAFIRRCEELSQARSSQDMECLGLDTNQLFRRLHPDRQLTRIPFAPHFGELKLQRNAIPNCRSESHDALLSLFVGARGDDTTIFGLDPKGDESISHIALSFGKGKTVHLVDTAFGRPDRIYLPDSLITVSGKLRVHLFPYGLCTSYLILSLAAASGFTSRDLITFLRVIYQPNRNIHRHVFFNVAERTFDSINDLFRWSTEQISRAVLRSPETRLRATSEMNCAVCLNTERAVPPKERLGILMRDPNWHSFDDDFVKSYPSIFGKYVGDFSVLTSNNLLLSLTVDVFMDGFIKRKSRIRIYWGLMNIFHFISARKFLCRLFSEEVTGGRRAWGNSQNDALEIERIILWLNSMRFQHRRLRPARRKFYHQVSKTLSLEPLERELSSTIARYQVREDARENSAKLNRVLTAVHQGRIEQGEVLRTLDAIRRVIRYNQALDSEQCGEIRDLSKKANKAIKSRMSVNQKLELTLPLLPAFLNYKFEVVKGSELDLEILRSEILEVWNDLLARA